MGGDIARLPDQQGWAMQKGFGPRPPCLMRPGGSPPRCCATTSGGDLRPATWDEALEPHHQRIPAASSHAPARMRSRVFGGGGLTNEKAYLLGKFARVALGTANIDYNGRFCMGSGANGNLRAFGVDRGLPFPLEDIPGAEAILLTGGNPAETMPPIMQYFEAQRRRGRAIDRGGPAAQQHRQARPPAPADHPRHRRRAGKRAAARSSAGQADRRNLHQHPHQWLPSSAPDLRLLLAGPGGSASPVFLPPKWNARRTSWGEAATAMVLSGPRHRAAEQRHGQRAGVHQLGAGAGESGQSFVRAMVA